MIYTGVACNLDTHVLRAALPLLQRSAVHSIEWSFDTLFQMPEVPDWFLQLLQAFGQEGRLIGHGVFFSLFSGRWTNEQAAWLQQLAALAQQFQFDHITEHFGFMTGADFHKGAPISIPFNKTTLAIGQDRLKRIYNACQCPVGLENLAFAYSLAEVQRHGAFLNELIEPVNGFIILDVHNLYCQLHNFQVDFEQIIASYPLERVREIHVSGGSWETSRVAQGKQIRRDTHDSAVPEEVFNLLEKALDRCPNVKFVILEQLGTALDTVSSQQQFQQDYVRLNGIIARRNIVSSTNTPPRFLPKGNFHLGEPLSDLSLYQQQQELSQILETASDYFAAKQVLSTSSLANTDWEVEAWAPEMLETVLRIAQKWKHGFSERKRPTTA